MNCIDIIKFELKRIDKKVVAIFILFMIVIICVSRILEYRTLIFYDDIPTIDTYSTSGWLGIIKLSDIFIPVMSLITILYVFWDSYDGNINEVLISYNSHTFNLILLTKWIAVLIIYTIILFVSVLILYQFVEIINFDINEMEFIYTLKPISVFIKTFPTLLWYTTFPLITLVFTKNKFIALSISTIYTLTDIFYILSMYPFVSMINVNGFYIQKEFYLEKNIGVDLNALENYFITNRLVITTLCIITIYIIARKSLVLKKSK